MKVASLLAFCLLAACSVETNDDLLARVPQLQATAELANGGALGCGWGEVEFETSTGKRSVGVGLETVHVFGKEVDTRDLVRLLDSRVQSNRSAVEGPMSGNVDALCWVITSALSSAEEPLAVSPLSELLSDARPDVRNASAIALYDMGDASAELRAKIQEIGLPRAVVDDVASLGHKCPDWVVVQE